MCWGRGKSTLGWQRRDDPYPKDGSTGPRTLVLSAHPLLLCSRSSQHTCSRRDPSPLCWPFFSLPPPFSSLAPHGPAPRAPLPPSFGPLPEPSSPLSSPAFP